MVKYSGKTDKGNVRETNEDSFNIISGYPGIPAVFVVADGMGGHNSGEIASRAAVDVISEEILNRQDVFDSESDIEETIRDLMLAANKAVYTKSLGNTAYNGMGTTLIIAVIVGKIMYIGHVGDSRLYQIRNGNINQITTDHSYIEALIRNGSLTREQGARHPKKNIITRALGCMDYLEVDTYKCEIENDDCFVICTDGLTNMLEEETIKCAVSDKTPYDACEYLVAKALENGGEDNITVIVIKNE